MHAAPPRRAGGRFHAPSAPFTPPTILVPGSFIADARCPAGERDERPGISKRHAGISQHDTTRLNGTLRDPRAAAWRRDVVDLEDTRSGALRARPDDIADGDARNLRPPRSGDGARRAR